MNLRCSVTRIFLFSVADVTTTAFVQGEMIRKKGVEYYKVKSFKWKIEPGEARSLFTNLFNGDKTLGISLYSGTVLLCSVMF